MATAKLYLDTRRAGASKDKPVSMRIAINHRSGTGFITLNFQLLPSQWDKKAGTVKDHPQKALLNVSLAKKLAEAKEILLTLSQTEDVETLTAAELTQRVKSEMGGGTQKRATPKRKSDEKKTVRYWFDKWIEHKSGGTRELYDVTRKRLVKYCKSEEAFGKLRFEDITKDWLIGLVDQMSLTAKSANTRGICLRNLRTVCNYAIDNEVTTYYPFRRFKIETQKTRKRNLDVHILRRILFYECAGEWQEKYLDFFKLTFMLIGINSVDLFNLEKMIQGRVEYVRAKTHKPYSVKVEPEAKRLFDKYKGTKRLLGMCDNYVRHKHFFNNLSKGLNSIKDIFGLEELTTYWARHSWATIARKIGVSKDTIGLGLGHSQKTVTDIYIEYDPEEIDNANRKVLDWVLHGKIDGEVVEVPGTPKFFGLKKKEAIELGLVKEA